MSASGQKQTLQRVRPMSAILPKADIDEVVRNVRFVPKADILQCGRGRRLFANLVRLRGKIWRYLDAERLGSLEVDNEFKLG